MPSIKVQEGDRALQRDLAKRTKEDLRPAPPGDHGEMAVKLVASGSHWKLTCKSIHKRGSENGLEETHLPLNGCWSLTRCHFFFIFSMNHPCFRGELSELTHPRKVTGVYGLPPAINN